MNCLAVRLIAKQGVLTDNGILIDSAPSTLLGKGGINLAKETIAWTLKARTKMVGIGSLLPALEIGGSLMHPSYKIDEAGVITNVVGALTGNGVDTGVPEMQTAPAGQNACLYTLDHPKAPATPTLLSADTLKNPGKNIQNIGKALIKGFFGQ